jgi:hypothetical protein
MRSPWQERVPLSSSSECATAGQWMQGTSPGFFSLLRTSLPCKTPGGEKERKMKGQDAHDAHLRMIMKKNAPETGPQVQAGHSWHESPPRRRNHFAHHTACHEWPNLMVLVGKYSKRVAVLARRVQRKHAGVMCRRRLCSGKVASKRKIQFQ